jgi:alpha-1,3-rhamnosyl/mannosyltransferase
VLRVGIDGRAFSSPAAGVRRYVEGLVPALQALDDLEIVALGGQSAPEGLERVAEPWHPPSNLGWAVGGLPRAAARGGVDVIHAPAYTGPLWSRIPVVLTIHDVSYARHPEWYPYRRDWLRRAFYRRSAQAAAHILTDSEFSAGEIAAAYGISRSRLTVAHLGVNDSFTPAPGHPRPSASQDFRQLAPLQPFLLHVGDLHPRRNLAMVTRVVIAVRRQLDMPLRLVLAGVDRGVGDDLSRIAAEAGAPDAIIRLEAVDDRQLCDLYRKAVALVYPSRYEGFGLPVLEAMASGTPVIAARAASIPEVLGDAGVLITPDAVDMWTAAIAALVGDSKMRSRMRHQGLARAAEFTWARTARITADAYHRVAPPNRA